MLNTIIDNTATIKSVYVTSDDDRFCLTTPFGRTEIGVFIPIFSDGLWFWRKTRNSQHQWVSDRDMFNLKKVWFSRDCLITAVANTGITSYHIKAGPLSGHPYSMLASLVKPC